MTSPSIKVYDCPAGIALSQNFSLQARPATVEKRTDWRQVPAYAIDAASVNTSRNEFDRRPIAVASVDVSALIRFRAKYLAEPVRTAVIRPLSLGIETRVDGDFVEFSLEGVKDVMLEINGSKWKALHILTNEIDLDAPTEDTDDVWYFGPGINEGSAYQSQVLDSGDGVNLMVPSGKTVYLAGGAFVTCRIKFVGVSSSAVRGHGFIYGPRGCYTEREWGGAVHMSQSSNIVVQGVTSLNAEGFSLSAGECSGVQVDRYRCFSSSGNGDGVDFFCSSDITIERCFLRSSDDAIALYSHRRDWKGDSRNITIRDCVLLPDIAHGIIMGTHGNPEAPETTSGVRIENIDILDHDESQLWYQGCIAINAADENLFENIHVENVRVERITRGQLVNIRVMQNAMWTTAPGRGIRNVTFKNLSLEGHQGTGGDVINLSQIMGYNAERSIENVTFENLRICSKLVHRDMEKLRWFMVEDFVPVFINEHAKDVVFKAS